MEDIITNQINRPIELGRFLTSPGESQEAEYKAAIEFNADSAFGLKLVKHALGMANIGGGVIIVGYMDSPLIPDPKHNDKITATYDTTRLADAVNKCLGYGQEVHLAVHTPIHPATGKPHPIIQVHGFDKLPLVCKSDKTNPEKGDERILKQGAIYIRRRNGSTSEIQTPQDLESLIERCVAQKRDEFLRQFVDLYDRMSAGTMEKNVGIEVTFGEWIKEARESSTTIEFLPAEHGYFESAHMLLTPLAYSTAGHPHLVQAMKKAKLSRYSGWPMGIIMDVGEFAPIPRAKGIEIRVENDDMLSDYWRLDSNGSYYFSRFFREDHEGVSGREFWFDLSIINITEALLHSATLYRALGVAPNAPYLFAITYEGLVGRALGQHNPLFGSDPTIRVCKENAFPWQKELTQDLVKANLKDLVFEAVQALLVMFDFASVPKSSVDRLIDRFMGGSI